jgi:hypothetical protein
MSGLAVHSVSQTAIRSPIITHTINKWCYPFWHTEWELSVMKTACRPSWCSWGTSSNRMATTIGRSTEPSIAVRIYINQTSPTKSPSCLLWGLYSTVSAGAGPTQHQICGLAPHEIIHSSPSSQSPPWTKDTRGLQDPLWVWQGLHWADGPFRGHQVKEASTALKTRTSRQVSHSWTHYLPQTPHSIPQFFHPHQENQIYGPHCPGGHWDWTPTLQYQQRGWLLSQ